MAIANVVSAAGQEFIFLKGADLETHSFGGIGRRPFFDLDLLVSRDKLPEAQRLLKDSGYVRKSAVPFNETLTSYFTHAFDFAKSGLAVDLHCLSAKAAHKLDYRTPSDSGGGRTSCSKIRMFLCYPDFTGFNSGPDGKCLG